MSGSGDTVYHAVGGLERTQLPDGFAVYDPARRQIHYLNATAAAVLQLCETGGDAQDIADALQSLFDLASPPSDDVVSCLSALQNKGLVTAGMRPA